MFILSTIHIQCLVHSRPTEGLCDSGEMDSHINGDSHISRCGKHRLSERGINGSTVEVYPMWVWGY